ncbi:hypothetical protein GEMRC1_010008 [Eukaryota sp. GEM-RC1]
MSRSDLPLKSSPSLNDSISVTDFVECDGSSSGVSSSNLSSDTSSAPYSPTHSPSNHLHFQQSILTLIHLHYLSRLLESSLEWNCHESCSS